MGFARLKTDQLLVDRLRGKTIGLGGHNEVVAVQAANLMRPPRNGDAAQLCENCRMMSFGLRERTDLVRELERFGEVLETKDALKLGNSFALRDFPVGNLRLEFGDFLLGHSRRIGATGATIGFLQRTHAENIRRERTQSELSQFRSA
jgi:hypothetical protein